MPERFVVIDRDLIVDTKQGITIVKVHPNGTRAAHFLAGLLNEHADAYDEASALGV